MGSTGEASWQYNAVKVECTLKRGRFIGKVNSLLQEFHFVEPKVKIKLLNIFAFIFYGSGLWDLHSAECERLYKSWNVAVRIGFGVPPSTHRYLIEPLSGTPHAKTMLCSRYVKFKEMLCSSNKPVVKLLASLAVDDNRAVMGKTMTRMRKEVQDSEITAKKIKSSLRYFPVPDQETWRLDFLEELVEAKAKKILVENMTDEDVNLMIDML